MVELAGGMPKIIDTIETGRWGIDGKCLVNMQSSILKERQKISVQGIIFISIPVDDICQLQGTPIVSFCGVVEQGEEHQTLMEVLQNIIRRTMSQDLGKEKNYSEDLQRSVKQECNQRFGKKPIIDLHFVKLELENDIQKPISFFNISLA